jgi:hypothetical protein
MLVCDYDWIRITKDAFCNVGVRLLQRRNSRSKHHTLEGQIATKGKGREKRRNSRLRVGLGTAGLASGLSSSHFD